ncbi:MAG: molybdopterin oxidoreductase family protein, partial [Methylocystis sp.]
MKGFIGSSNVDTNSRLCMASTVAGYRRAFGSDIVPACYEDIDQADLVVIVGSNTAWCHPILFHRILNRRIKGAKVVVVDTRRTITADSADLYLEISPGTDQALFCGLLAYLDEYDAKDNRFILERTTGYKEALRAARNIAPTVDASAAATGVDVSKISKFYKLFSSTERVITIFSQGVNQSSQGVDKVNSIINCHLATGRIGKPGASPFSFTGQPNAMGGREVGGLANILAAHMGYDPESIERLRRFWDAPNIADKEGLKAIQMFEAISRGEIKALWVCGTNPAASLPDADRYRQSFSDLELFVVSDNVIANDTIKSGAQIILPALAWGEKNGTVTNSERRISRQRAFLVPPQEARADWEIFAQIASRMGFSGFDYRSALDVFREHAELSTFENEGRRDFDIGGLSELTDYDYENLQPVQWPVRRKGQHGQARFFEDGVFFTSDQRAHFIAIKEPQLASNLTEQFPLYLNTGRVRDQWHTMTRTGLSEKLARDNPEPFIEISPEDAVKNKLKNGGFGLVKTVHGQCILRIKITDRQATNSIFAPIHWTNEHSSNARVGSLVSPAIDPISGQPELKATPVAVSPILYKWEGFLLSHQLLLFPKDLWWTKVAVNGIHAYHLAGDMNVEELVDLLKSQIDDCKISKVINISGNIFYENCLKDKKCRFLFFIGDCIDKWD